MISEKQNGHPWAISDLNANRTEQNESRKQVIHTWISYDSPKVYPTRSANCDKIGALLGRYWLGWGRNDVV